MYKIKILRSSYIFDHHPTFPRPPPRERQLSDKSVCVYVSKSGDIDEPRTSWILASL